jgi:AcrR family transcriptional regulator
VDKKRQLLDAAERVYCQHGNLGLTVRRLAAEGDTTSQTIYTYFGSRDAVIVAMHDRAVADLERLLHSLGEQLRSSGGGDPQARLLGVTLAYRAYCLEHPAHYKMLAEGLAPEDGDPAAVRALQAQLIDLVEQAQLAAGIMPRGMNDLGARQAIAMLHGLIQAELDGFLKPGDASEASLSGVIGSLMGLDEKVDSPQG